MATQKLNSRGRLEETGIGVRGRGENRVGGEKFYLRIL